MYARLVLTLLFGLLLTLPSVVAPVAEPQETVPAGWTHRPVMEHFTSLGCPPCMSIDPDVGRLWTDYRDEPDVPWTYVSFHQRNGAYADDEFASKEAKQRYEHYVVQGTPDAQFDGGYIEELGGGDGTYETYLDHYTDSGEREVKPTELRVWQEFREDRFVFRVNLTYLGDGGLHDPFIDPDELEPAVYLFVVEDDIMAWSSEEGKEVMQHNTHRETALHDERPGTMQPGEEWSTEVEWVIPDIIDYVDGHEDRDGNPQEGPHPIPTPINPAKIEVVAVVYDLNDNSRHSSKTSNAADTPRAINSATPRSTAYDEQNEPPTVTEYDDRLEGSQAVISATLADEDGIGSAYVIYNFRNGTYDDGKWGVAPMALEGDHGTAVVEFAAGDPVWYRILLVDGKGGFAATDARQVEGTGGGDDAEEALPGPGIALALLTLAGISLRRRV